MKPWREVAVPHRDVLEGTFQQSEFAADITAVSTGRASREYQDAGAFFDRTFITEGMRQCRNAFNTTEFPKGSRRECSDGWVRIVYGLTENRQAVCLT